MLYFMKNTFLSIFLPNQHRLTKPNSFFPSIQTLQILFIFLSLITLSLINLLIQHLFLIHDLFLLLKFPLILPLLYLLLLLQLLSLPLLYLQIHLILAHFLTLILWDSLFFPPEDLLDELNHPLTSRTMFVLNQSDIGATL